MYIHHFEIGENSAEFENRSPIWPGAASLSGEGLILSDWHMVGMSVPSDLYNKRGEAGHGEQECVYYRFTIDEVVLTEEILVIKKEHVWS